MPASWTKVDPPQYRVVTPLGQSLQEMPSSITVYTDGSGGKNSDDPRLRRCGWAWVIPGLTTPDCGSCRNLLGQQTVPRAEITARIEFVRELEISPRIKKMVLHSDCKMVVDLLNECKERCKQSRLWELWRDSWELYDRIEDTLSRFGDP